MKVFDTTVLVAYLRGISDAARILDDAVRNGEAHASVLSRVELEGGMRSAERSQVGLLLASLRLEPVSNPIAAVAGEFMRRHRRSHPGIDTVDYVIAATAELLGAKLMTLNVRHFPMFRGLKPAF